MKTLKTFDELFEGKKLSREELITIIYNTTPINTEELEKKSTEELEKIYKEMKCDKKLKKDKKIHKKVKKASKEWTVSEFGKDKKKK